MPQQLISRRAWLCGSSWGFVFLGPASRQGRAAALPEVIPAFRHIHLDFHTSPAIPDVGADFKAEEFARVLKEASVNSITIFAKCHHGMSYYPTQVGVRHPGLKIDLVGEMIEACHRAGIRVPVYISTMYDQHVWRQHGDWRVLDAEGRLEGHGGIAGPLKPYLGRVCVNTPYLDYLAAQGEEVLKDYDADGLFWDNFGYGAGGCLGPSCMLEREKMGLDSANAEDRRKHAFLVMQRVMDRLAAVVRSRRPKASIFINGPLHLRQKPDFLRSALKDYTHIEIESLPGGTWGYSYFQMASRYLRNLGLGAQGMTGGFHRSWGDFGTVRNQAALDYECFSMLAQATRCAIGDHLHPRGTLTAPLYERIGRTYRSVVEKEPWCDGATAITEIGCLLNYGPRANDSDVGVNSVLTQLRQQFDFLDPGSDFSRYRLLVLADSQRIEGALRQKVLAYAAAGGKLLLSHESGLDAAGDRFALPDLGLEYQGPWKHEAQYIEVLEGFQQGIPKMVHEAYETGSAVKALPGTTALARVWAAYFDRDYRHFQVAQTPFSNATDYVAVAARGNFVYIATPIFRTYARSGYAFYRQLLGNCIERLLPDPLVRADLPSSAQVTMTEQPGRRIVHILYYVPERRAPDLDVVEDVIPLANVKLAARLARSPRQVYLAPQRRNLPFEYREGYARVTVPEVRGHQMVVFES